MHADYLNTDASSEDKKIRLKTLKIYKDTLIKAKELGAGTVVMHPGTWLENNRREEKLKRCAETFTELEIFSKQSGVKIAIENLPPGFICDNADDLEFVLESVINNSGQNCQAGICLDTGHANISNNLFSYIKRFGNRILSMHLHDNHGDTGRDKTFAEEDLHILPGDGSVNWKTFFKELDSIGYDNAFIFELMRENTREKDIYKILSGVKEFLKYHEDLS
jgi:sugar phosphate isomerase/epimerase